VVRLNRVLYFGVALAALILPAQVWASDPTDPVVARAGDQELRASQLADRAIINGFSISDPWGSWSTTTDPATKTDSEYFLELTASAILWDDAYAARAKAEGFLPSQENQEVDPLAEYCGCLKGARVSIAPTDVKSLSPEQINAVFEANPELTYRAEGRMVALIFKHVPAGSDPKVGAEAMAELKRVRQLIDEEKITFRNAAMIYSDAPSAKNGGDIGQVTAETPMNKVVRDFLFQWPEAGIYGPTKLHNGVYLLNLQRIFPGVNRTREQVLTDPLLASGFRDAATRWQRRQEEARLAAMQLPVEEMVKLLESEIPADNPELARCRSRRELRESQILAWHYFESLQKDLDPTPEEVQKYYDENPSQMKEMGLLRLTRYDVPARGADTTVVRNLAQATDLAKRAREALANAPDPSAIQLSAYDIVVYKTQGWVNGVGHDAADTYLHRTLTGPGFTPVFTTGDKAFFVYLHEKREMPLLPLKDKEPYIRKTIRGLRLADRVEKDRRQLGEAKIVWRKWKDEAPAEAELTPTPATP